MRGSLKYTTLWRSGGQIASASQDQLKTFAERKHDLDSKNLRLDTSGTTTQELKDSLWNKVVILDLISVTKKIVANTKDGRFGTSHFNWKRLYKDRFQKLYQEIHAWRHLPHESEEERGLRLSLRLIKRRKINKSINIRHLVSVPEAHCLGSSLVYFLRNIKSG